MSLKKALLSAALVVIVLFVAVTIYIFGDQLALRNLTFKDITPTQAAEAMKNDDFFSDYKENTLVIKGTVSSVTHQINSTTLGLKTNSTYQTLCKLDTPTPSYKVGDPITIVAIGGNAVRQTSGVLLQNCITVHDASL